jgi:DNA-binding beta-propeller fold protein YncE
MLSNTRAIRITTKTEGLAFRGAAGVSGSQGPVPLGRKVSLPIALLTALLVVACCALWVSTARAERTVKYVESGQVATGGSENQAEVLAPRHLLVDQGHKTLVVADSGHGRLAVYNLAGTPSFQQEVGAGTLSSPYGVAIDEASKYLYVSDAGTGSILRYTYTSGSPAAYTLDKTFASPPAGNKTGQIGNFAAALAVDPTTHDLLVADQGNHLIDRFTSAGVLVNAYSGDSTGTLFSGPTDVAVGTDGTTYVMDLTGSLVFLGVSRLERYNTSDEWLGPLTAEGVNDAVAVNHADGTVYAGGYVEKNIFTAEISGLQGEELIGTGLDPVRLMTIGALAVDDAANGKIYASTEENSGQTGIRAYTITPLIPASTVTIAAPTATATSIHVGGTVDAGSAADSAQTSVRLEYSTDQITWTPSTQLPALTGSGVQTVSGDITGLAPHTQYYVRIAAIADATVDSEAKAIGTGGQAPAIENRPVNERTSTSAAINVQINPLGLLTTYHYEYGSGTAYGQRLPLRQEAVAGTGHAPVPLTVLLSGLTPGGTYHYRIVAQNSAGISYGEDVSFSTPAAGEGPPARVYEQVTPTDKHGGVVNSLAFLRVSENGTGIGYATKNAVDSSATGSAPVETRYVSLRGSEGWEQYGLSVPRLPEEGEINLVEVMGVSRDLTHEIVVSDEKLAEGAVEGKANIYRRDVLTGQSELIVTLPYSALLEVSQNTTAFLVYGGTSDYSKVVLSVQGVYEEWSNGTLTPATLLPDGTQPTGHVRAPSVSEDDSTIGFSVEGGGVYVRRAGHTIAISVSHRAGDDPTVVHPGSLGGASVDGRYYYFNSDQLTADAPEGNSTYRYDLQTGVLTYVATDLSPAGVSASGKSVVLANFGGLFLWREGHLSIIVEEVLFHEGLSVSPEGRYVTFISSVRLTSYDNDNAVACATVVDEPFEGHCPEVYVYDGQTKTLHCASCPPDGALSIGAAALPVATDSRNQLPNVDDLGQVFFYTASSLVPQDTNGAEDVYEYQDGEVRLISPGTRNETARAIGSSADGRNVYFTTEQQLVAQDTDSEPDIYDAHIEGGLTSQTEDRTAAPECGAGQCPEALGGGTAFSALVASVNFVRQGVSGSSVRAAPATVKVVKKLVTGSSFTVSVTVPGKGRLVGTGGGAARVQKSVPKAGTYKLRFSLTAAQKRKLARAGKLRVKVRVAFTPVSGASSSAVVSVSLKGKVSAKRAARTGGRASR